MTTVISLENVSKSYRGFSMVSQVTLQAEQGSVLGIVGPKGAGKSTVLYLVSGILKPTSGTVATVSARGGGSPSMGVLIEGTGIYPNLAVRDQVEIRRRALSLPAEETERVLGTFGLKFAESAKAGQLALPVRNRLGIALAMMGDPEILLLDEPFRGFTFREIDTFRTLIREYVSRTGGTVVITSEKAEETGGLADTFLILDRGRSVKQDTSEGISSSIPGYMKLEADPLDLAKEVLDRMGIYGYRTINSRTLFIYEQYERLEEIREALLSAGVYVTELSLVQDSISDYYTQGRADR